jgi:hypothetical protein
MFGGSRAGGSGRFEGLLRLLLPAFPKRRGSNGVSCYALKQVARSRADASGVSGGV